MVGFETDFPPTAVLETLSAPSKIIHQGIYYPLTWWPWGSFGPLGSRFAGPNATGNENDHKENKASERDRRQRH